MSDSFDMNDYTEREERRAYFRIDDTVGLSYSPLQAGEDFTPEHDSHLGLPLASLLSEIDHNFNQATNTIWNDNPTVARALGLLNRKISLLAAHALQREESGATSYDELVVNISGCGMAFYCDEPQAAGTRLAVTVVLKPSNIELSFSATVVACEAQQPESRHRHWMRISIDPGNDAAQEELIQHVVQRQCASLEARANIRY